MEGNSSTWVIELSMWLIKVFLLYFAFVLSESIFLAKVSFEFNQFYDETSFDIQIFTVGCAHQLHFVKITFYKHNINDLMVFDCRLLMHPCTIIFKAFADSCEENVCLCHSSSILFACGY